MGRIACIIQIISLCHRSLTLLERGKDNKVVIEKRTNRPRVTEISDQQDGKEENSEMRQVEGKGENVSNICEWKGRWKSIKVKNREY